MLSAQYVRSNPYDAHTDAGRKPAGQFHCVGGQTVFFGAAAFRNRAEDFESPAEIVGDSGAQWPIGYDEMEPVVRSRRSSCSV
jgi:choline dehydrogenase-like flavoprotein